MKTRILLALLALLVLAACTKTETLDLNNVQPDENVKEQSAEILEEYNPNINPADFSADITNKYFKLTPRTKWIYEGKTEEGLERIEYYVLDETKTVMGVTARVVWDRVWLDGDLIEETFDWYSQDKEGNVWYFGEETYEVFQGEIQNTNGAWEAGIDGALPGIYMKASPKIGDSYYQEYYEGEAEDRGDVLSLTENVKVPMGSFANCLKTRDYTLLDPGADEHKYYCIETGNVVLEIGLEDGERVELISLEHDVDPSKESVKLPKVEVIEQPQPKSGDITEEEAIEIALLEVSGEVTDVAKERKFGRNCYVIEIDADNGPETDVIIEISTGEVLAVEE